MLRSFKSLRRPKDEQLNSTNDFAKIIVHRNYINYITIYLYHWEGEPY